jgi:hypothetical protein
MTLAAVLDREATEAGELVGEVQHPVLAFRSAIAA